VKIGDIVYVVPTNPHETPKDALVWYAGLTRFSAGDFTFIRGTEGDSFIGSHSSAHAYASKDAYVGMCVKRDAWDKLRYIVANTKNPPRDLGVVEMQMCINLLKGKQ
jgi:hypothetical protein